MKGKTLPQLFAGLACTLIYFSCSKPLDVSEPKNSGFVNEAKCFVDQNLKSLSNSNARQSDYRVALEKSFNWSEVHAEHPNETRIIEVPIRYKENLYVKRLNGKISMSTQQMSRLLVYEDHIGKLNAEIVTKIPDDTYLSNAANQKDFSGTIYVEELNGSFIKGFVYQNGQVRQIASLLQINIAQNPNQKAAPDGCGGTIDWFSCASGDGGASWSCVYSHSSPANCSGSGGEFPDRGPRIVYTNTGGSGHPSSGGGITQPGYPAIPGGVEGNRWPGDIKCSSFKFGDLDKPNTWTCGVKLKAPSFGDVSSNTYREFPIRPVIIDVPKLTYEGNYNQKEEVAKKTAEAFNDAVKALGMIYGPDHKYLTITSSTYELKFKEFVEAYLSGPYPGTRLSYSAPLNVRKGLIFYPSEHKGFIDGLLNLDDCTN